MHEALKTTMAPTRQFYGVADLTEIFGLSPHTLQRLIRQGKIRGRRMGKEYRVSVDEVERLRAA